MKSTDQTVKLPSSSKAIEPLGVGTWAWGDKSTWGMGGYDSALTESTIREAWKASLDAGVRLFDTAEVYGGGESERIIGRLLAEDPAQRDSIVIATKFFPSPLKLNVKKALRDSLLASLDRLGIDKVDLYQLHGPISLRSQAALAESLAIVHREGLVDAVGVSNYSVLEMSNIHRELSERGLALASNQIEFSPLRQRPETSGLLAACERLGVVPLAYSPLGQGRLTGKYSASNPPPGNRDFSAFPMERVDPLVDVLRSIGQDHAETGPGGEAKSPGQVALRWIIEKGAVPIPGAKNRDQALQNAGALGWSLSADEVSSIDAVAFDGQRTLKQRVWQHG